ncbi:MAG: hypothetical protein V4677_09660 [Bacteroidota bacterium]
MLHASLDDVFHKFSYRISDAQLNTGFLHLKYLKKAINELFKKADAPGIHQDCDVIIFDSSVKGKNDRISYLTGLVNCENANWIYRESLPNHISLFEKIAVTLFLIFTGIWFQVFKNRSKNKTQLALFLVEIVEWLKIFTYCRKLKSKNFLFFCAYEKDANFISYFLMNKLHLSVQFIPSSNPLSNFYKKVVCTTFTFTAPYQKHQYELLKKNWYVKNFVSWPIFNHQQLKELRPNFNYSTTKNTVGFMSSGNWLREELGEKELGLGEREAEKKLMACLKKFIESNQDVSLTVFLHPYEKRTPDRVQRSMAFYQDMFGDKFKFGDLKKATIQQLDLVDVGIAVYSSVLFERLFVGFKTMFGLFNMPYNYFSDDRLLNISAYSESDFNQKLSELISLSNEEYIEKFNLQEYIYNYKNN